MYMICKFDVFFLRHGVCVCMCMWTEIIPSRSFNSHGVFSCKNIFIRYTYIYKIGDVWFCCAIFIAFQRKLGYAHPFHTSIPILQFAIFRYTSCVCMCMLFSSLGIIFFFIFSPSDIGLRNNRNIRAMAAIHSRLQVHHTYYGNACACERACMYVLVEFWLPVTTIKMTLTQT